MTAIRTFPNPVAIVAAPSNLGLKQLRDVQPGVRRMADALLDAGLGERLGTEKVQRVEPPPYTGDIDPATGVRNAPQIEQYSRQLADALKGTIAPDHLTLVLGGDCSILLGATLALREMGRYGLLFVDGHSDMQTPETSATKAAAGMDLALVTGRGPDALANINGLRPYVRDEDVVLFGFRDAEDIETYYGREVFTSEMLPFTLDHIRLIGGEAAVEAALDRFRDLDGFWIHFDVDALDSEVMPAVDSPMPDGFQVDEIRMALRLALANEKAVGLQMTIFDPDLDPDGQYARALVEMLAGVFTET